MTLAEFKKEYRQDNLDVILRLSIVGYGFIGLGLLAIIKFYSSFFSVLIFVSPSFAIGLSVLYYMKVRLKLTRWDNGLTKKQNEELLDKVALKLKGDGFVPRYKNEVLQHENYLNLCYKWRTWKGHQIRLFADEGYILINGHRDNSSVEGLLQYRSASRFQKEILQFLKDSVSK